MSEHKPGRELCRQGSRARTSFLPLSLLLLPKTTTETDYVEERDREDGVNGTAASAVPRVTCQMGTKAQTNMMSLKGEADGELKAMRKRNRTTIGSRIGYLSCYGWMRSIFLSSAQ